MSDLYWMQEAYQLALLARAQGEIPVGAVLISEQGKLVGRGWNQVVQKNDPCAHAELLAIRDAAHALQNYRLDNTTLYVTLEPCCMCAGAIIHARIKRLVFATRDFRAGAAGSVFNLLQGIPLNHRVQIDEGLMQEKSSTLLLDFFKEKREVG
jgi:tRNA(adenine34) deaminase